MRKVINTEKAPEIIGQYSQEIVVNNMIYVSGQLPIVTESEKMPETIEEQTRVTLNNIKAILEEAGSSIDQVIKTTVFLSDMNNFTAINEVYKSFFSESYPTISVIEVSRLPKDAFLEVEVIAIVKPKLPDLNICGSGRFNFYLR